jgi:hypothetical protein
MRQVREYMKCDYYLCVVSKIWTDVCCRLPASDVGVMLLCMRCLSATSRWYGLMFVAVLSYFMMWGDVVVDGID